MYIVVCSCQVIPESETELLIFSRILSNFTYQHFCYSQQWLLDKQDLARERQADLKEWKEDSYEKSMIFFANCMFTSFISFE